jgi:hypothetical protein
MWFVMQTIKSAVLTALQSNSALSTLYGNKFYFQYPPDFLNMPVGSYFELSNIGDLFADNQEIGSEIIFQIDLWGKSSLTNYALGVDSAMTSLDFFRIQSIDLYEKEDKVYHKSMRYRLDYSDPNF